MGNDNSWSALCLTRRVVEGGVDPVVAAALAAFAFVFIHPFEDGNAGGSVLTTRRRSKYGYPSSLR